MFYRLITSGYTDAFAYISAFVSALWIFVAQQYASVLPALAFVSPVYGVAVAAFFGALLICKHICLEGNADALHVLNAEKSRLAATVQIRDQVATELKQNIAALNAEVSTLRSTIATMEENSSTRQLSELRMKLRTTEEDKKAALSVLVKNLQARLAMLTENQDPQLLYAADILRQELGLLDTELKRGEFSDYELCIKIVDISGKLSEIHEINLVSSFEQSVKPGSVAETWLHFIRANDNSGPAAVERSFKFFKVAFHPDKFNSESLKVEATKYFQHSINAHNSVKRMENAGS